MSCTKPTDNSGLSFDPLDYDVEIPYEDYQSSITHQNSSVLSYYSPHDLYYNHIYAVNHPNGIDSREMLPKLTTYFEDPKDDRQFDPPFGLGLNKDVYHPDFLPRDYGYNNYYADLTPVYYRNTDMTPMYAKAGDKFYHINSEKCNLNCQNPGCVNINGHLGTDVDYYSVNSDVVKYDRENEKNDGAIARKKNRECRFKETEGPPNSLSPLETFDNLIKMKMKSFKPNFGSDGYKSLEFESSQSGSPQGMNKTSSNQMISQWKKERMILKKLFPESGGKRSSSETTTNETTECVPNKRQRVDIGEEM